MNIKYKKEDKILNFEITEEIDHYVVEDLRRDIDSEITRFLPRKIVFDFSNVSFMDSAGIGLIIGRYKFIKMLGGDIEIVNVNSEIKKILEMSGILKIIMIKEAS